MNHCRPVTRERLSRSHGRAARRRLYFLAVSPVVDVARDIRDPLWNAIRVDSWRWRLMSLTRRSIVRMWLFVDHFRSPCRSSPPLLTLLSFSHYLSRVSVPCDWPLLSALLLSASFSPSITRVLSFSLALATPRWTGSYNECLCRQTHSLASWPTMTLLWKYHGRLSRSLACAPRDFERELDSRGE